MENPKLDPRFYPKNEITYREHRRQIMWQIYLPIGVVVFLVVLAAILVIFYPELDVSMWADIALIMLVSLVMIAAIIFLALNIFAIIGTRRGLQILPYYLFVGQSYTFRIRNRVRQYSDMAVKPIIATKSNFAKIQAVLPKRKIQ